MLSVLLALGATWRTATELLCSEGHSPKARHSKVRLEGNQELRRA